jgi:hypothetical protein
VTEQNKATVRRLIEEVFNGGRLEVIDELYTPELAPAARRWITPFRASFPDVHMEVVELIAEGDQVVGRFTCSATHRPPTWEPGWAMPPPAGASSGSMRSPPSGCATARSSRSGHWKTASGGSSSSAWPERERRTGSGASCAGSAAGDQQQHPAHRQQFTGSPGRQPEWDPV